MIGNLNDLSMLVFRYFRWKSPSLQCVFFQFPLLTKRVPQGSLVLRVKIDNGIVPDVFRANQPAGGGISSYAIRPTYCNLNYCVALDFCLRWMVSDNPLNPTKKQGIAQTMIKCR